MDMTETTLYSVSRLPRYLQASIPIPYANWDNEGIANALRLPGGNHRRFTKAELERLARLLQTEAE